MLMHIIHYMLIKVKHNVFVLKKGSSQTCSRKTVNIPDFMVTSEHVLEYHGREGTRNGMFLNVVWCATAR